MDKMDFYVSDDPREKPLGDTLYRAIARLTDRPDRRDDAHLTSGLCKWRLCATAVAIRAQVSLGDNGHSVGKAFCFPRHFLGDITNSSNHKQG